MPHAHTLARAFAFALLVAPRAGAAQALPPSVHVLAAPRDVTASRRPIFAGISDPGVAVLLTLDGRTLGRAQANARGQWSFVTPIDLREGDHRVAFAVDDPRARAMPAVIRDVSIVACDDSRACEGATPVCDAATARCRSCTFDAECGADHMHPVCSAQGASRGMCVAPLPELVTPMPGHAIGPSERSVQGRGRPHSEVVISVDGVEAARTNTDARGWFSVELLSFDRGWRDVVAANVEQGLVGPAGPSSHVLAAACVSDLDCAPRERCDMLRLACDAR